MAVPPPGSEPFKETSFPNAQLENVFVRIEGRKMEIIHKNNLGFRDKFSHFIDVIVSLFSGNTATISYKYGSEAQLFWKERFTQELNNRPTQKEEVREI